MAINRENFVFYFKALLCLFLIALWSFWFTYFSKENIPRKIVKHAHHPNNKTLTQLKKTETTIIKQKKKIAKIESRKSTQTIKATTLKEKTNTVNKLIKELPKLATLTPVQTIEKKLKSENNLPKEMINLNLPKIASATRKALLNNHKKNEGILSRENNPTLRKIIPVEKNKLKPVFINLREKNASKQKIYPGESLLPTESSLKDLTENPDKIIEQIELAGIVNKPNGESTAIIKDKANNYIEILKKGDKYNGLKLLEISKSEIVLGNEISNKMYIKRINTGK